MRTLSALALFTLVASGCADWLCDKKAATPATAPAAAAAQPLPGSETGNASQPSSGAAPARPGPEAGNASQPSSAAPAARPGREAGNASQPSR